MSYLLDTNIISEARKSRGNKKVKQWVESVSGMELYLSVLVIGEVRQGVERLRRHDSEQASVYDKWLTKLRRKYSRHILPITEEIAEEWGRMNVPDPISAVDGLMAATAIVHDLTLVTRNTRDVERTGVDLFDPFDT